MRQFEIKAARLRGPVPGSGECCQSRRYPGIEGPGDQSIAAAAGTRRPPAERKRTPRLFRSGKSSNTKCGHRRRGATSAEKPGRFFEGRLPMP